MLKVFIGYDHAEAVAYYTLEHSIHKYSSVPVSVAPLRYDQLPMWRERDPLQSTDFSFSRFLVPSLCDYQGVALFVDCDMLFQDDIKKLFNEFDPRYAVQVVKHPEYTSSVDTKFLGNVQSNYPKKNWSSVMLFNNPRCHRLTPTLVNEMPGSHLHRFMWCADDEVGELDRRWNILVGEPSHYQTDSPGNLHYTLGTPCFPDYRGCEYSNEWYLERDDMLNVGGR